MVIVDQPSKTQPAIHFVTKEEDLSDNPFGIHVPLLESGERANNRDSSTLFSMDTERRSLGWCQ